MAFNIFQKIKSLMGGFKSAPAKPVHPEDQTVEHISGRRLAKPRGHRRVVRSSRRVIGHSFRTWSVKHRY